MTDAEMRTRILAVLDQHLPIGDQHVLNLYGNLIVSRGRNCGDHFLTIHRLSSRGASAAEISEAVEVLIQSHPEKVELPIVISLHGIFTTGGWQKRLAPIISRAQMVPEPFDYGFFMPYRLLLGWLRNQKIEKFLKDYTVVRQKHQKAAISICAHSFGTYIVGYAMLKYEQICFDQIILCGSILPADFPWDQFLAKGRVRRVLNEYGGRDSWARRVTGWVQDAGPSGYSGFTVKAAGFFQRHYQRYKHSDFFHPLQFEQNWLPFLRGAEPGPPGINYSPPANKPIFLILLLIAIAIVALWWLGPFVWHVLFHSR